MESTIKPGRIYAIAAIIIVLGLVLSIAGGAVAGGAIASYVAARQPAQTAQRVGTVSQAIALAPTPAPTVVSQQASAPASAASQSAVTQLAVSEDDVYEQVYDRVNPSVVEINVGVTSQGTTNPFGRNRQQQQGPLQYGSGSGFVYDTDGYIVTNNHVVENAQTIRVTFSNDVSVPATLVGRDPDSDLAVIKVDPTGLDLQPVELADSDVLHVGQRVIAIGNPFGLQNTLTTGVVSALGRSMPTDLNGSSTGSSYSIPDVIQTDAAINPGNSGGPLLDVQGRVIGVNFAIESQSGASAGVGFAIPVNFVKQIVPVLMDKGSYQHPYLGVSVGTLTTEMAQAMNLPTTQHGALVASVAAGGPAAAAGLRAGNSQITIDGQQVTVGGDVITAIEGRPVNSSDDLILQLMRYFKVGDQVKLTVIRDGKTISVTVTLAARPATS
jgi:S1-C subfamily serine protease